MENMEKTLDNQGEHGGNMEKPGRALREPPKKNKGEDGENPADTERTLREPRRIQRIKKESRRTSENMKRT